MSDINTLFIEHIIHIMKSILEGRQNKEQNEQPQISEHLGVTSIEGMMLGIVRYVRHLDMTVHAIHIKTKLCQLVEVMMKRRDDLAFRQEMKFRNKLVEYLTDWVMGKSILYYIYISFPHLLIQFFFIIPRHIASNCTSK